MNKLKINLGWIAAGVLGGVLIFSGFGQSQEKFGVVDQVRLVNDSKLGQRNRDTLQGLFNSRDALLQFMGDYLIISQDQSDRLKSFATKPTLTEADKKDEEAVKAQVRAEQKQFNDLNTKVPLTDDERLVLSQFNKRITDTPKRINAYGKEFQAELTNMETEFGKALRTKAKEALDEVAKKGGYSVILELGIAPYGANDITDEALKALDAKTN